MSLLDLQFHSCKLTYTWDSQVKTITSSAILPLRVFINPDVWTPDANGENTLLGVIQYNFDIALMVKQPDFFHFTLINRP